MLRRFLKVTLAGPLHLCFHWAWVGLELGWAWVGLSLCWDGVGPGLGRTRPGLGWAFVGMDLGWVGLGLGWTEPRL